MAEPTVPVREMVDLIVDQWNRGLEAHEALRLLLPLTYRVLNAEPSSLKTMVAPYVQGSQEAPYDMGDEVWTGDGVNLRQWFVDQSGAWVEAAPDDAPALLVQQAWHGDDPTLVEASPEESRFVNRIYPPHIKINQHAATEALARGAITPEQVGDFVKGLHPDSPYKVASDA